MRLRPRSQKDGKRDSSLVGFLSQVIEFPDFGAEHNIQLPAPSKEAEQPREAILAIVSYQYNYIIYSGINEWNVSLGSYKDDAPCLPHKTAAARRAATPNSVAL